MFFVFVFFLCAICRKSTDHMPDVTDRTGVYEHFDVVAVCYQNSNPDAHLDCYNEM